jgi:hypothetical protein
MLQGKSNTTNHPMGENISIPNVECVDQQLLSDFLHTFWV